MANRYNYGHHGPADYSRDSQSWTFGREYSTDRTCLPLGDPVDILDGEGSAQVLERGATNPNALVERFPEIRPTPVALLKGLPREPAHSDVSSPAAGRPRDVLAIGRIAVVHAGDRNRMSGRTMPVIALPAGPDRSTLKVALLDSETATPDFEQNQIISPPKAGREIGYWIGNAEPILQIEFASVNKSRGSLLAVRLPSRTLIFRPLWHNAREPPAGAYLGCPIPPSRIEVRPILALPASQTGGSPHVDVTFDPHDQRLFAILDRDGNFTVFKLSGRKSRSRLTYHAAKLRSGSLMGPIVPAPDHADSLTNDELKEDPVVTRQTPFDSRCMFNDYGLLLIREKTLQIVNLTEGGSTVVSFPLGTLPDSEVVLDVLGHPRRRDCVILLSTSHVFCLQIRRDGDSFRTEPLVSWPHYRDRNDETLRLQCLVTEELLNIIVFSNLSGTATMFECPQFGDSSRLWIVRDPVMLSTPPNLLTILLCSPISGGLLLSERGNSVMMLYLSSNLRVSIQYFISFSAASQQGLRLPSVRQAASESSSVKRNSGQSLPTRAKPPPLARSAQFWASVPGCRSVLDRVSSPYELRAETPQGRVHERLETLETLAAECEAEGETNKRGTLFELVKANGGPLDLESLQVALDRLLGVIPSRCLTALPFRSLADTESARLSAQPNVSLLQIYDSVVAKWISPLSGAAPVHYRTRLSVLASRIACEISLAIWLIRPPLSVSSSESEVVSPFVGKQAAMSTEKEDRPQDHGNPDFSQSYPTDLSTQDAMTFRPLTPETTPSLASGSSSASKGPNAADAAYERLSRLTDFVSRPPLMPPRMNRVLDHWSTGVDPAQYDWTETRRSLETDRGRTRSSKAERRARRHLERQRREAEREFRRSQSRISGRLSQTRSSPIPEISRLGASQSGPTHASREAERQQSQATAMVVASQVERGLFGDRSRGRAKKKPRMAGF